MTRKELTRKRLRKWREDHGLSQPALAELLGVHWMTISSWERGRQDLPGFLHLALSELDRQLSHTTNEALDTPQRIA